MALILLFMEGMRWFCAGHFAATWLVCTSLLVRFHTAHESSIAFIVFSIMLWPVVLWALPLKGYFHLKAVTLDRLKARVHRGELKKMVVFGFGFCTSLLAALSIGFATWAVGALDSWFSQQEGALSLVHTIAWFPIAFLLWILIPTIGMSVLARQRQAATLPQPVQASA
jgi:hypothetical protein